MSDLIDNLNDLAAVGASVLADITEESDTLSGPHCVDALQAIDALTEDLKRAREMVAQQAVYVIEQPIQQDGRTYSVVDDGAWVRDEDALESQIITAANGDVVKAVEIAFELCIPKSKLPTKGGLAKLGLAMRDVASWRDRGRKLRITDDRPPAGER